MVRLFAMIVIWEMLQNYTQIKLVADEARISSKFHAQKCVTGSAFKQLNIERLPLPLNPPI